MRQMRPLPGTLPKAKRPVRQRRRKGRPLFKTALLAIAAATPLGHFEAPGALHVAGRASSPAHASRASAPPPTESRASAAAHELVFAEATDMPRYRLTPFGAPILGGRFQSNDIQTAAQMPPPAAPLPPLRVAAAEVAANTAPAEAAIPLPPLDPNRSRILRPLQVAAVPLPPDRPLQAPSEPPAPAHRRSPRIRNASLVARTEPPKQESFFEKIFGHPQSATGPALAYAPASEANQAMQGLVYKPRVAGDRTAIYNIASHVVIMPDGTRLEAHSGLGSRLDDPRFISEKDRGPTPPNVYNLELRRQLFHGVQAIRLNPQSPSRMFGRDGILAHTYMLGPRGDSNGCISFRDYRAFLSAYLRGEVTRIVVVKDSSSLVAENTTGRSTF